MKKEDRRIHLIRNKLNIIAGTLETLLLDDDLKSESRRLLHICIKKINEIAIILKEETKEN